MLTPPPLAKLRSIGLLLAGLMPLSANAVTVPVAADTTIDATAKPKGKATSIVLNASNKGLLRFDVTGALPPNTSRKDIVKATLYVYVNKISNKNNAAAAIGLTALAQSETWAENTAVNSTLPPTLANPPLPTTVPVGNEQLNQFVPISSDELTEVVRDWVDAPAINNGVALALETTDDKVSVQLDSKEATGTGHSAFLEIVLGNSFAYKIGDTGPGGGIIFYVDRFDEFPGFTYLEAAPSDASVGTVWCQTSVSIPAVSKLGLGSGQANTTAMLGVCTGGAANVASAYVEPTAGWYLPSKAELDLMYTNLYLQRDAGSLFAGSYYWSSSEDYNYTAGAWAQIFLSGKSMTDDKVHKWRVRAVRAF